MPGAVKVTTASGTRFFPVPRTVLQDPEPELVLWRTLSLQSEADPSAMAVPS
jgi:hypothetical protein